MFNIRFKIDKSGSRILTFAILLKQIYTRSRIKGEEYQQPTFPASSIFLILMSITERESNNINYQCFKKC